MDNEAGDGRLEASDGRNWVTVVVAMHEATRRPARGRTGLGMRIGTVDPVSSDAGQLYQRIHLHLPEPAELQPHAGRSKMTAIVSRICAKTAGPTVPRVGPMR